MTMFSDTKPKRLVWPLFHHTNLRKPKTENCKWMEKWLRKRQKAGNVSYNSMHSIINCRSNNFSFMIQYLNENRVLSGTLVSDLIPVVL